MSQSIETVQKLLEIIEKSQVSIAEIEVSDEKGLVRVRCGTATPPVMVSQTQQAPEPLSSPHSAEHTQEIPKGTPLLAPMVGTVYLAPSPDSDPFVKIGQRVQAGDTICLIEAMKMFNKVEAEHSGTITECLIKNGQPVEFNQPLFTLDDSDSNS